MKFSAPEPDPERMAQMQELLDKAMKQSKEQDRVRKQFMDALQDSIVQSKPKPSDYGITWEEVTKGADSVTEAFRKMGRSYEEAFEQVRRVTQIGLGMTPGHKTPCQYDGSYDWPCTCQPRTLWGRTLLWHCDCCGHPLAPMKYGLCDVCHAHQYDPPAKARADHEAEGLT